MADVYEHTRDFDRYGCIIGARHVSYALLERWYVCRECGGSPVHKIKRIDGVSRDWAECTACGMRDFIPQWLYDLQVADAPGIIERLPESLRALFPEKAPLDITAEQAISDLYGL
jgi:hypothetical protein